MPKNSYQDSQGYIRLYEPNNPCSDTRGYIYEHRKKVSDTLNVENPNHPSLDINGCLKPSWMVHHDDEVKNNNSDDNLDLMKGNGHKSHHFKVNNPHPTERDEFGRFV